MAAWRARGGARSSGIRRAACGLAPSRDQHRQLVVGGSGKTPLAAFVAALAGGCGERPAILSRGYRRERAGEPVVVVSDGERLLANFGARPAT